MAARRRRTWRPLLGRLWGPDGQTKRSLPGEWSWARPLRRRKRLNRKGGTDG